MSVTLDLLSTGTGIAIEIADILENEFDSDPLVSKSKLSGIFKTYECKIELEDKSAAALIIAKYNKRDDCTEIKVTLYVEDPDGDVAQEVVDEITGLDVFDEEKDSITIDVI